MTDNVVGSAYEYEDDRHYCHDCGEYTWQEICPLWGRRVYLESDECAEIEDMERG